MSDIQRELIGSVVRGKTKKGDVVADLFSTDTRLEFPVLVLFDLSMLAQVGIDPNALGTEPVYRRFWAYFTESEKKTSKGNPYKDVQYLEPLDTPATTTSVDSSALLAELRAIRGLLQVVVDTQGLVLPQAPSEPRSELDAYFGDEPEEPPEPADIGTLPTSPTTMLAWAEAEGIPAQSAGHLLYGLKKVLGQDWNWPVGTDSVSWYAACAAWTEYNEAG
jgi:hypothetical protein